MPKNLKPPVLFFAYFLDHLKPLPAFLTNINLTIQNTIH